MNIDLESLGLTRESLAERIVETIADRLLNGAGDGDESRFEPGIRRELDKKIKEAIDGAVEKVAEAHLLPKVTGMLEGICLQATNEWGEKKGNPLTFVEYLIQRAEAYMHEKVSFQGKSKSEDSYNWNPSTTRIAYMVHEHLQYSIQAAMKKAMENANASIIGGINEAVKLKLGEVAKAFQVSVSVGR